MDTQSKGTIPNGYHPELTLSRMDTIPNGHNSEWTRYRIAQSRMYTIPNGHRPELTQSRMHTIPNAHNPEWAQGVVQIKERYKCFALVYGAV